MRVSDKKNMQSAGGNVIFYFLLLIIFIISAVILFPVYSNYRKQQVVLENLRRENRILHEELMQKTDEAEALKNSPEAVEKVAREKYRMVKDGEKTVIYEYPGKK